MENGDNMKKTLEELGEGVDRDAMNIGLTISDVFQTVTLAAVHLPEINLRTEHMELSFDGDSIEVKIRGLSRKHHNKMDDNYDDDCEEYQDEEEEGLLYDEY